MERWFTPVAHVALAMVGLLLGESFLARSLRSTGRVVLWASIMETLFAAVFVFLALCAADAPLVVSLLLAAIAPARAPAATLDVVRETRASGPLTRVLLGVVAIDDAWGVILFSVLLCAARLPQHGGPILSLVIATSVVFELFAPMVTTHQLRAAGEVGGGGSPGSP